MGDDKLSDAERSALEWVRNEGSLLTSHIPEKSYLDVFGVVPGLGVFKRLERRGLIFFTEEDPLDDGFVFTNEVYLTDEGNGILRRTAT